MRPSLVVLALGGVAFSSRAGFSAAKSSEQAAPAGEGFFSGVLEGNYWKGAHSAVCKTEQACVVGCSK